MTTRTDQTDPATPRQIRAIQVQRRVLGLDEDTYRRALAGYPCHSRGPETATDWPTWCAPCRSAKHLTRAQARRLITRWSVAGAPVGRPYSTPRPDPDSTVTTLPSPGQRALIARLVPEIAWRTPTGYHGWLTTRLRLDPGTAPRTHAEADAIIEGLKALQRHGHARPAA